MFGMHEIMLNMLAVYNFLDIASNNLKLFITNFESAF